MYADSDRRDMMAAKHSIATCCVIRHVGGADRNVFVATHRTWTGQRPQLHLSHSCALTRIIALMRYRPKSVRLCRTHP